MDLLFVLTWTYNCAPIFFQKQSSLEWEMQRLYLYFWLKLVVSSHACSNLWIPGTWTLWTMQASARDCLRFFDQVGHQTSYAYIEISIFSVNHTSLSGLPKLWTTFLKIAKFVLSKLFFSIKILWNPSDFLMWKY